jgi:hypothetical protein
VGGVNLFCCDLLKTENVQAGIVFCSLLHLVWVGELYLEYCTWDGVWIVTHRVRCRYSQLDGSFRLCLCCVPFMWPWSTLLRWITMCKLHAVTWKGIRSYFCTGLVRRLRLPGFLDSRHVKVVTLSALRTGRLYPQVGSLMFISVRVWVDRRAVVQPEGLSRWKIHSSSIGNRTRDLPDCSAVPQPNAPPYKIHWIICFV